MSGVSNTAPLRALLKEAVAAHDLTTDKIADNARGARARSWLAGKQTELWRKDLLDDAELDALAAGYKIPRRRLREADLEGFGLMERNGQPAAWILEDEVIGLSRRQRQAVRAVIAAMLEPATGATVTTLRGKRMPAAGRAADRSSNRGRATRRELDRQAETPPPVPEDEP